MEIASYLMPLTGPYDSRDEAVLEYQVLLMRLSGIDGVIVDWYGMEDFRDYGVLNASTHALFDHVQRAGLRFAICYEDQTIKHMVENNHLWADEAEANGQAVMQYLETTWFGEDAYLKVAGRPVLLVFGPQYFTSASEWEMLFSELDVRPALVTLDGHTESAGLSSFPWPPMWAGTDGILSRDALARYLTGFYRKAALWDYQVAGAFPGFRDIYEEAGIASEARVLDPEQGETFQYTLDLAIDQEPDVVQLITWNDYGESTSLEPTEEFGYRYLERVQAARRATDPAGFPFAAEDLRLPLRLYELREAHAGDAEVQARLDGVLPAILEGDMDTVQEILAEVEEP
jgi:hypothetical protein